MSWFKVKDLMINVIGNGGGSSGIWDDEPLPSPATPYVVVAANRRLLDRVRRVTRKLAKRDASGTAQREVVDNVALGLGRGIVYAAIQAGGGSGLPGPDDDVPTPRFTIPGTSPIIHDLTVLDASHLPQLEAQLRDALQATEAAAQEFAPDSGKEVRFVQGKLEEALADLGTVVPQG